MNVTASLLTWNRGDCLKVCFTSLLEEADRLRESGHSVDVLLIDNGSNDSTALVVEELCKDERFFVNRSTSNVGSALGRNRAFDFARQHQADFHLLLDGDIQVVPWSVCAELQYLSEYPQYCSIGPHWDCQTADPSRIDAECREVKGDFDQICAPTQYGLFRKEVFQNFEFDPHFGPGYGFEDEDFGIQLRISGLRSRMFAGIRYLHHGYHSSLKNLRETSMDMQKMWEDRKEYVLKKWQDKELDQPLKNLLHVLRHEPLPV